MKPKILWAFLTIVVTIGLAGCQSHSTNPPPNALVKLGFELESNDLATLVELVTLTVEFEESVIDVDTLNLVEGVVTDTVTLVPDQTITIILRAYSGPRPPSGNRVLLYVGDTTFMVPAEETFPVNILLAPPPELLMLRAGPLYQSAALEGDTIEVFVDVHNVDELFGAAFRLQYDPEALNFVDASEGDFIRGDGLPTLAGIIDQTTDDIIPYFVTRLRGEGGLPPGVSGSGRLATFRFTAITAGTSLFTIGAETANLTRPDGAKVAQFDNLILESATLDVQ